MFRIPKFAPDDINITLLGPGVTHVAITNKMIE